MRCTEKMSVDMACRTHVERNPEARKAAQSFKATEFWWSF